MKWTYEKNKKRKIIKRTREKEDERVWRGQKNMKEIKKK